MTKINFNAAGCCPKCGSFNVEFGDIHWSTDKIITSFEQECRCEDCDCEYKEQYLAEFEGKEITCETEEEPEWIECDYCHEEFIKDDVKKDEDGKWICCGCNKNFQKVKDFNF